MIRINSVVRQGLAWCLQPGQGIGDASLGACVGRDNQAIPDVLDVEEEHVDALEELADAVSSQLDLGCMLRKAAQYWTKDVIISSSEIH
mgnify:CR=1 FL=1